MMWLYALEMYILGEWRIIAVDTLSSEIKEKEAVANRFQHFKSRVVKYTFDDLEFLRTYATDFRLTDVE